MFDLKEWYQRNVRQKVLNIINGLAAQFLDKNGKPDWREAVKVFSQFVNGTLPPKTQDIVDNVIDKLGLTNEVQDLKKFWQKIPEQVRTLLTKSLDQESGPVTWEILGQQGKGVNYGTLAGPLKSVVNFGANAGLALELQSLNSNDAQPQEFGITCTDDERFLRMGMNGRLTVDAGLSLPFGFLGIKGKGGAEGNALLDYYYQDKADWLYVEALITNISHLASPFNPIDIAGEYNHRLSAIHLNVTGQLNASLDISGGKTWGTSFNVKNKSLDLDTEVAISAGASVGFTAGLNLAGSWDLLVKPLKNNQLSVKLQKDKSKEKNTGFSLDASIGVSGLNVIGEAVINKYLPDAEPLLDKFSPFLNIGSLLKEKLETQLSDWLKLDQQSGFKAELENSLLQDASGDSSSASVSSIISNKVQSVLDSKLDLLESEASNFGQKIISDVATELKLPGSLADRLVSELSGKVDGFLTGLRSDIQAKISEIVQKNQGMLTSIFKPLEAVGTEVNKLSQDANKLSQLLLQPVITFLTRYQNLRNKITAAVEKTSQLKIGLNLSRTYSSSRATTTVLEFKMDPSKGNVEEYYKEMVSGNFANALAAAKRGEAGIILVGGSFKAMATDTLTTDFGVNLFGAQFSSQTILSSDVQVQVDATGNVLMAHSQSEMSKVFKGLGETRMVKFVNLLEIPGSLSNGNSPPGRTKLFSSGLTMSYQDNSLKATELQSYLGSLEGADLITPQSLTSAVDRYNQLAGQARSQKQKMGAEIALNMSLKSSDIAALIAARDGDIQGKAIDYQLKSFFYNRQDVYKQFVQVVSLWNTRNPNIYQQIREMAALGKLGDVLIRYNIANADERRDMNSVSAEERYRLNTALEIGLNAENLVKIIRNIEAAGKIQFTSENLQDQVNTVNALNKKNNKYLKHWLKVGGLLQSLGIKKEEVPPVTLAFIATIGDICRMGYEGTGFLTPAITWSVGGGQMELFP